MTEVSIIIPSYNTCRFLINCLDSIYKTSKIPLEIIVVDNGSTDETVKEIKKQNEMKILRNKRNLGFAKAVNQGLKQASGEYLLLLNSDTVVSPGAIEKMVDYLEGHPEVGVVGCQLKDSDGSLQPSGGYLPNLFNLFFWMTFLDDLPIIRKFFPAYHLEEKSFYEKERELGWVTGAFFLTKKDVLKRVGFLDEKMFMYVEEVDWCLRVKKAGFKIFFTPDASIIHLKGASGEREKASLPAGKAGILEEYKGIKYYFQKHKPNWQGPILRLFLKLGALVRVLFFGIIWNDLRSKRIYAKAFKLV